jgi:zinc transport system permease protein
LISEIFSYAFFQRAFTVGILVSLCAALLGVSLVLKHYSMIGDGLSHVGFGTLAIASVLGLAPLAVTIPVTVVCAFLLLRLGSRNGFKGDAAIALISASAMAIGVTVVSLSGTNSDLNGYLFGSILAMSKSDVWISAVLCVVVMTMFVVFYNRIFAVTFDEGFAKATGIRPGIYNSIIALLTAVTVVLGMRMMGALLISSLLIFPALTAMRVCKTWRGVTIFAASVSIVCFITGLFLSYFWSTPTGASVVIVNLAAFLLCGVIGKILRK